MRCTFSLVLPIDAMKGHFSIGQELGSGGVVCSTNRAQIPPNILGPRFTIKGSARRDNNLHLRSGANKMLKKTTTYNCFNIRANPNM